MYVCVCSARVKTAAYGKKIDKHFIIRPRRSRSAAAYSRKTFPWTICRTCDRPSVCPVHCGKTADRIRMPFGIIGRTGLGIRQVVGFGDRSTGRGTFGANLGCAIVTNGDFTAYVCDSTTTLPSYQITLGKLVFIQDVTKHIGVLLLIM